MPGSVMLVAVVGIGIVACVPTLRTELLRSTAFPVFRMAPVTMAASVTVVVVRTGEIGCTSNHGMD